MLYVDGSRLHPLHARMHALVSGPAASDGGPHALPDPFGADRLEFGDEAFLTGLYRELLGREPDDWGLGHHLENLKRGTSRAFVRQAFLASPEYLARLHASASGAETVTETRAVAETQAVTETGAVSGGVQPARGALPAGVRPLGLHEYPKANPAGSHGIPNYLQTTEDVAFVLDRLQRVGARNTLLIVPFPSPAELRDMDRAFLEGARARGITVQLRLGWNFAGPDAAMKPPLMGVDPAQLRRYTEQVAAVLGHGPYIQIGNEPNLAHEWHEHPIHGAPFARWWARYALAVAAGGGYPGLPGMAAGAWDTPDGSARNEFGFYREVLQALARDFPQALDRAWFGAHPYHMYADAGHPDYVEDVWWQLGEYDKIHREMVGRSLPVLVTESGYVDGPNARRLDPGNAAQAEDVARFKRSLAGRPDWLVVGTADWLVSNRHGANQWRAIYGPGGEATAWASVLEARKDGWSRLEDTIRR